VRPVRGVAARALRDAGGIGVSSRRSTPSRAFELCVHDVHETALVLLVPVAPGGEQTVTSVVGGMACDGSSLASAWSRQLTTGGGRDEARASWEGAVYYRIDRGAARDELTTLASTP
jgi:hypothetical protein